MRKLTIFIFVLTFFSGCFFDFSNDINSIDSANNIKAEIINYKRNSKISYNYIFNDISSGKIYQAHSNRYYFNSGDRVYMKILFCRLFLAKFCLYKNKVLKAKKS